MVDEISRGGVNFLSGHEAFVLKMECHHSSNMHCAKKGVGYDLHCLQVGIFLCPNLPADVLDFQPCARPLRGRGTQFLPPPPFPHGGLTSS